MESITLTQARRVALAAQGLHRPRNLDRPVTGRGLQGVVDRIGLIQIDSVNVLARAHLMPGYSRLGPYDVGLLERATSLSPRRLVETWAHVASFVPPETYRLLDWRRREFRSQAWHSISSVIQAHPDVVDRVRDIVAERGPITATAMHEVFAAEFPRTRGQWGWNWSVAKRALEFLFFVGEVGAARRTASFERCYDLIERVLPPAGAARPAPDDAEATRALMEIGARAHGIGTRRCFADYFRLRGPAVDRALSELVDAGTLLPIDVRGWAERTYLHAGAARPRAATGTALLNPFDPLVFERTRLERLFDVRYRIEIYVPAARRTHGYYVLPFLEGERITARVDLKAERARRLLQVRSAHAEACATPTTPHRLAAELRLLAGWLGLDDVVVAPVGDLAAALAGALRRPVVTPGPPDAAG